jgi:NitT/TauT family transport system ATP-binding protein
MTTEQLGSKADTRSIELSGVSVDFSTDRGHVRALERIDFSLPEQSFIPILGPSGCGKSTLLRAVADLVSPSEGKVSVLGESARAARLNRDLGFVFQDATLLPWRTAIQNVRLPLEVGPPFPHSHEIRSPQELLELVGLGGRADAYPHELSGGMKQRVAIARALVSSPRVLLMDEPFGALDEITRDRMNEELLRIWENTNTTVLFVTHSIPEAVFLGQQVVVLEANPGRLRKIVPIDLPYPRQLSVRDTTEFLKLTAELRSTLESC